ncbi:MAG: RDD family protein [Sphingomonas sp.]
MGRSRPPPSLRRRFLTPEGVDLRLELAGAGTRAIAFVLDCIAMLVILIALTIAALFLFTASAGAEAAAILWLIGSFALRNGWFALFEMGGRGATPGKRIMRLRVVARDGARLTGGAVLARNAMREVELFLPLSFLAWQTASGQADAWLALSGLLWTGILLLFPLFNRDRLRLGDLVAGTWVVQTGEARLTPDLAQARPQERRVFGEAALSLYGIYELQTLEDVLRADNADTLRVVADSIRRKAGLPDDGDDRGFLTDYYVALCARLERGVMLGRARADKHADKHAGVKTQGAGIG